MKLRQARKILRRMWRLPEDSDPYTWRQRVAAAVRVMRTDKPGVQSTRIWACKCGHGISVANVKNRPTSTPSMFVPK